MRSEKRLIQQAFRFELDPNEEQRILLAKSVGASRYVYNWGLAESREWYGSGLVVADRFYPSSKSCSGCGVIKVTLGLSERVFVCDAAASRSTGMRTPPSISVASA